MNPIPYSTICAAIAVMCYSMILTTPRKIDKCLLSICLALASFTIMIGQSRGVWLALLISFLVVSITYIIRNPITKKGIFIFLSSIMLVSSSGYFTFHQEINIKIEQTKLEIERIESGQKYTSIGLRLQMWEAVPKLIHDSVLLGNGDNHSSKLKNLRINGEISKSLYEFNPTHYHNQFLDKQVKSGLIGLFLLVLILTYPLFVINKQQNQDKPLIYGVISLYFIASLTDVPFNHPQTLMVFLLILYPHCTEQTS
ncbi:O-antigen ligase [uncultured Vibrio sp.]|uniref:O-antigen ligase family protein n=1 Tax=uncultured Vibrio sp. TaxID=114054 RepID=UPI00263837EC|nr:O-antigen ligase family protein [uncultured Vibrio sp.]